MLKYLFVLSAAVSFVAFAAPKKTEVLECQYVTILQVETDENGREKIAIIKPYEIRCNPQKVPEPEVKPTKTPRFFPKQP